MDHLVTWETDMDQKPFNPIEKLTVAGRLLLIVTFLLFGGSFALCFWEVQYLPTRSYPVVIFLAPIVIGCVLFFYVAGLCLERLGIRIYNK